MDEKKRLELGVRMWMCQSCDNLVHDYREGSREEVCRRCGGELTWLDMPTHASPTVASALAGMFLDEQVRKGRPIEIPSLGITLTKDNVKANEN